MARQTGSRSIKHHREHCSNVIMSVMAWRLKLPASRLFTQPFIQAQIKENTKAPRHWTLWEEFTGDRWILRTKGQYRGKCFHLMASLWVRLVIIMPEYIVKWKIRDWRLTVGDRYCYGKLGLKIMSNWSVMAIQNIIITTSSWWNLRQPACNAELLRSIWATTSITCRIPSCNKNGPQLKPRNV